MKKRIVSKLIWLLAVISYTCPASSQDSTGYTLSNIKKYASRMDESFAALSNRAGDERKTCLQATERLKAFSDSIEEEMEYLPDDYYFRILPLISVYRADIDEYEKLVMNDDFEDKEKLLTVAFSGLQQRQVSFRRAVASACEKAVSGDTSTWNLPTTEESSTQLVKQAETSQISHISEDNDNAAVEPQTEVAVEKKATANNAVLLDTIHADLQQIENAVHLADHTVDRNDISNIRLAATRIADASLQISGLSLLLDAKGKENLYMLAASLRHAAENLRTLAKKGIAARSAMKESLNEIKIKLGSLSTGISFVK